MLFDACSEGVRFCLRLARIVSQEDNQEDEQDKHKDRLASKALVFAQYAVNNAIHCLRQVLNSQFSEVPTAAKTRAMHCPLAQIDYLGIVCSLCVPNLSCRHVWYSMWVPCMGRLEAESVENYQVR